MKTPFILNKIKRELDESFKKELVSQGHSNSGKLEASINGKINGNQLNGEIYDYGFILNDGVKPNRIPYRRGSGAKSSKYIDSLVLYFKSKGLNDKDAKSAAFATAMVQKKQGMSTKASKRFSKNGRRQGFLDHVIKNKESKIDKIATDGMDDIFNKEFNKQKTEII
ncbi:hypothetical protein [Empedobacter falsenii]|uniref:hypothetical protein n=1 Tax=Empedobacter falsenii TaxID=343874 RepID=UPI003A80C7F5